MDKLGRVKFGIGVNRDTCVFSEVIRGLRFGRLLRSGDRSRCFLPYVSVMKAADTRQPDNSRAERWPNFDGAAFGGISETRVDAISVVVAGVVTEEPAKVVLA